MALQFDVASLEITLIALGNTTIRMDKAGREAMKAAGAAYFLECKKRIKLTDHTLKDLARLGHPYGKKRHTSIQVHRRKPWQVHRQDGDLVRSIRGAAVQASGAPAYEVWFDLNIADHARYIVQGTKNMHQRDVLWLTALDPITQRNIMRRIVKRLGKELRTQIGVRFSAGSPRVGSQGRGLSVR